MINLWDYIYLIYDRLCKKKPIRYYFCNLRNKFNSTRKKKIMQIAQTNEKLKVFRLNFLFDFVLDFNFYCSSLGFDLYVFLLR